VAKHDPESAAAHHGHGLDVFPGSEGQRLSAHETGRDEPGGDRDHEDEGEDVAWECDGEEQQQEQRWDGKHDVDETHQQVVYPSAEEACDGAPEDTEYGRDQGRGDADLERGLAADHQTPDDVEAVLVGAERVRVRRRQEFICEIGGRLIRVVEERPHEAEQHHEHDDPDAHDGEPVLHEDVESKPPDALSLKGWNDILHLPRLLLRGSARKREGDGLRLIQRAHARRYLTRGSAIAYMTSAMSEPRTVAKPVTTMTPRMIG